jgi:general stress protein YciG
MFQALKTAVPNLHQHCEPGPRCGVLESPNGIGRIDMASNRSGGSKRGFAAMDPAKQREIASKGGKASHGGGRKSRSSR